ncbi:hypothetical protein [Mesorhizobium sp. ORS 3428]|uniref:hypothetical protein n=1 Tax=Mesorhizobium sp. ORS 3428 TaxID=540997 RepID=UPI0008DA756B|nr:hypothetical protein [Mesorhizobium sp. ORS 3428]OHV77711.1 hypothetical protein ORS3428_11290 [Mesorhizobium sp. ORS 3428]
MFETTGRTFFEALHAAAAKRLGQQHPCCLAIAEAARETEATAVRAAQAALNSLPKDVLVALMADAHKALREDPSAILGAWGGSASRH